MGIENINRYSFELKSVFLSNNKLKNSLCETIV